MEKNILIKVSGLQNQISIKDTDKIEMMTTGKFYDKGSKKYITYNETELNTEIDTLSTLKVEDNKITLLRKGQNNTHMIFEIGKKYMTHYSTPFGTLDLAITTRSIKKEFNQNNGYLKIIYFLEVNNSPIGLNTIEVEMKDLNEGR